VILNVTPQVGADGYTINLTLAPEVSEFLGFIDYGGPFTSSGVSVPNPIKQPLFSSQSVTTSIVIWDGQTVVLGGLMTEQLQKIDDKIPFLGDVPIVGRLFRSKVTTRSKRNLLIFVTARLIDPAGNPIHRTETVSLR
jgi:general secretion pathway protein D